MRRGGRIVAKKAKAKAKSMSGVKRPVTVKGLIKQGQEFLKQGELLKAQKALQQALALDLNNTQAMDELAQVYIEAGQPEPAVEILLKSIELNPDSGYEKYMNMGQLKGGQESLDFYRKGLTLLTAELSSVSSASQSSSDTTSPAFIQQLRREVSQCYCAMAELFLTDLCFEEQADVKALELVEQSVQFDPTNPEAFLIKANTLMSQERTQEAAETITHSFNLWKDLDPKDIPIFPVRYSTGKLMIELKNYVLAQPIFESLSFEDDENSELWYFLALSYFHTQQLEEAEECLQRCTDLLAKYPVEAAIAQVEELSVKIKEAIALNPPEENAMGDDGEDFDDEVDEDEEDEEELQKAN